MAKKLQIVSARPFQADWNIEDEDSVAYIRNKPINKIKNIALYASSWENSKAPYSQQIKIDVTPNSKIEMQPSTDVITALTNTNSRLLIKNDNGIITAYALNNKPSVDLNLQLTITEVTKENDLDAIWGNIV